MSRNKIKFWFSHIDLIFANLKDYALDYDDKEKRRIFVDRRSDILFIAHLDTVQEPKITGIEKTDDGQILQGAGFDDRLGCYAAYRLSKQLKADLLLTDNEEKGQSTAQHHTCKPYNWIAEFDRAGNDVVTYDCDSKKFIKALKKHWTKGFGSFSDIVQLKTKACCMNVGIGYEKAHSEDSTVNIDVYIEQIEKFKLFCEQNRNRKFIRSNKPKQRFIYTGYGFGRGLNDYYDDYYNRDYSLYIPKPQVIEPENKSSEIILPGEFDYCDYCGKRFNWDELIDIDGDMSWLLCSDCAAGLFPNIKEYQRRA
jgi:hypothetical protein